jgi:hypothetical protein
MNTDVVPALAANMGAAFKKVRGAIDDTDPAIRELIVDRIVALAKDGVYDIEELSGRTLSMPQAGRVAFTPIIPAIRSARNRSSCLFENPQVD